MIVVCKYSKEVSAWEKEELFKLKKSIGTRTSGYDLAINKLRPEILRFLTIRTVRF